jgi:hypothetical protein
MRKMKGKTSGSLAGIVFCTPESTSSPILFLYILSHGKPTRLSQPHHLASLLNFKALVSNSRGPLTSLSKREDCRSPAFGGLWKA